jgi:hypothetical protein
MAMPYRRFGGVRLAGLPGDPPTGGPTGCWM